MKEFIKKIEKTQKIIKINKEVSTKYEITKYLKKHPKDTILFKNIKDHNIPIISGISNTREKIALSLNTTTENITSKIINAMENPQPIKKINKIGNNYTTFSADLSQIPILTHYQKDGGPYITSGIVFAQDPETKFNNASIHRLMVIDKKYLAIRIVPRHLYTYYKKAQELKKDLKITIAIGVNPATLLATTTSIPITNYEMEIANNFHSGKLNLLQSKNSSIQIPDAEIILEGKILFNKFTEEGPFVDLTDTYDHIREEPIIELETMHIKKDPIYHAIFPAGLEHKLLQGLPQEPRIYKAVQNTVPTVQNVILTEGGCCWLHSAISIKKQTQGDAKNVIMAALAAHPSLKHVIVVDEDINIFDPEDIEYAIATRVKSDEDTIIVPGARGSSLDPSALPDGTTTKMGIDATKPLSSTDKFDRVSKSE